MFKTKKRKLTSVVLAVVVAGALVLPTGAWAAVVGDFKLFLNNPADAKATLEDFAPREIAVEGPKKYIESIEVIHKKGGTLAGGSVAITNIDVITKGSEADSIRIIFDDEKGIEDDRDIEPFETLNDISKFQLGLAGLGNSYPFDITIEVYDGLDVIDEKVFRVTEGTSDIFRISKSFAYKTSGGKYTLYDLLDDPALFTDLLLEHKLEAIAMSNLQ